MHVKLDDRVIKKKTLEGRMERRDCDNEEVFEFLQLLKKPKNVPISGFNPMDKEDWSYAVSKSKKGAHLHFFKDKLCNA